MSEEITVQGTGSKMGEPMRAGVSLKYQDNLGDYELLTTGIWLEVSAWAGKDETADELMDRIYEKVSSKVAEKVIDARNKIGS